MGSIDIGKFGLAYSVFIEKLLINEFAAPTLEFRAVANVHPINSPDKVIRTYIADTANARPIPLKLEYNLPLKTPDPQIPPVGKLEWVPSEIVEVEPSGAWGPDYIANLALTTVPTPQEDYYLNPLEKEWIDNAKLNLPAAVAAILPSYPLWELVPWLKMIAPFSFDLKPPYVIAVGESAIVEVGYCNKIDIVLERDPNFPPRKPPAPTSPEIWH